jgi:PAS domain S-box-containing protein
MGVSGEQRRRAGAEARAAARAGGSGAGDASPSADVATAVPRPGRMPVLMSEQDAELLRRDRHLLRRLVELSGDGLVLAGSDGRVEVWSPGMVRIVGLPAEDAVGLTLDELGDVVAIDWTHPSDVPVAFAALMGEQPEPAAAVRAAAQRWFVTGPDGERRTVRITGFSLGVAGSDGAMRGAVFSDVTEMAAALHQVSEQKATLELVLEATPLLVYIYDLVEDRNVYANKEIEAFLGYTASEVLAMGPSLGGRIFRPDDLPAIVEHHRVLREDRDAGVRELEYRCRRSDGSWRWLRSHDAVFLRDDEGLGLQIVGMAEDVTEQREAVDALQMTADQLQRAVDDRTAELRRALQTRDEFMARVTHDFRSPLNAILGFTTVILDGYAGPLTEEQRRQLGMVKASGDELLELVDEILDLSRLQSGRRKPEFEECDLADIADGVLESQRPVADAKGLEIAQAVCDRPLNARADPRWVRQILTNLVGNAVKFTESGWVRVECAERSDHVAVTVSDSGPGIPPEERELIFGEFHRAYMPGHTQPGTGLGLTIARQLARRLGGDVTVDSEPGEGSSFTLTLPACRTD